jgi:hypothetical protein
MPVAPQHVLLKQTGKQVFATALVGEDMFDQSFVWLDGDPMRPAVQYVLANGASLAFGGWQRTHRTTTVWRAPAGQYSNSTSMHMPGLAVRGMAVHCHGQAGSAPSLVANCCVADALHACTALQALPMAPPAGLSLRSPRDPTLWWR